MSLNTRSRRRPRAQSPQRQSTSARRPQAAAGPTPSASPGAPASETPTLDAAAEVLPGDVGAEQAYEEDTTWTLPPDGGDGGDSPEFRGRRHDGRDRRTTTLTDDLHVERTDRNTSGARVTQVGPDGDEEALWIDEQRRETTTTVQPEQLTATRDEVVETERLSGRGDDSRREIRRDARRAEVDVLDGQLESRRTQTETNERGDGRQTEEERERRTTTSIGDGALGQERRQRRRVETTDASGDRSAAEVEERRNAAVVNDEELGWGLRGGGSRRERVERDGGFDENTAGGNVTVGERGAAAEGELQRRRRSGGVTRSGSVSGDGRFSWDLDPVDEDQPELGFVLEFRIHLAANGRLSATREADEAERRNRRESGGRDGSASGRLSVGGSAGLTSRRVIPESEADTWRTTMERYESGGISAVGRSPFPELQRLSSVIESGGANAGAVGSADEAASLGGRESVELVLEANGGAGVSGEGSRGDSSSVSASVDAAASYQRTLRVEGVPMPPDAEGRRVDVTVTFVESARVEAAASATVQNASGGVRGRMGGSEGESITVRLDPDDPDYASVYDRICGTATPAELRRLARREDVRDRTRRRESSTERNQGGTVEAGAFGLEGSAGQDTANGRTARTTEDGEREVEVYGERSQNLTAGAGGVDVVNWEQSNRATGVAREDGATLDLRQTESDNDIGENVSDAIDEVREDDLSDTLAGAIARSPREHLEHLVEEQRARTSGFRLSADDVETLVACSGDVQAWNGCARGIHDSARIPWRSLGGTLRARRAVPADPDRALARNEAIVTAVAGFIEQTGDYGQHCFDRALHHFGEDFRTSRGVADFDDRAEQVGVTYEWPPSIAEHTDSYDRLVVEVERYPSRRERLLGELGSDGLRSRLTGWKQDLDDVHAAVRGCTDFEQPRARVEMLEDIASQRRRVQGYIEGLGSTAATPEGGAAAGAGPEVDQPADPDRRRLERERADGLRNLVENKGLERRVMVEVRRELDSWMFVDTDLVLERTRGLHESYVPWYRQVRSLRAVYHELGVDEGDWPISTGPNRPRDPVHEPHINGLIALRTEVLQHMTSITAGNSARDILPSNELWRREFWSY